MKAIFKRVVCIFIACVALSSCASVQPNKANVIIEKDTSSRFRIENVLVTKVDSIITVSGKLHSRTRGGAPGHVDITFVSTNGDVLQTLKADYRRRSLSARDYEFHVELSLALPDGSTVRIAHHRRAHNGNG